MRVARLTLPFSLSDMICNGFLEFLLFFGIYSQVNPYNIQVTNLTPKAQFKISQDVKHSSLDVCYYNKKWLKCPNFMQCNPNHETLNCRRVQTFFRRSPLHQHSEHTITPSLNLNRKLNDMIPLSTIFSATPNIQQTNDYDTLNEIHKSTANSLLSKQKIFNYQVTTPISSTVHNTFTHSLDDSIMSTANQNLKMNYQKNIYTITGKYEENEESSEHFADLFINSLKRFERLFYKVTFNKLIAISPPHRQENGISFIQSALFLYLALLAISTEVDQPTRSEIENCLGFNVSKMDEINMLRRIISWLPNSNSNMKFRWASRLVLSAGLPVSQQFVNNVATASELRVERLNGTETPNVLATLLNRMVEKDSGGAMRDTFEDEEVSDGVCSILLSTMDIRARWRSPPTVLNGTRRFYYASNAKPILVRMIRINDVMRYSPLDEWNADAIEIKYATPGLSLMLLVPRGHSVESLAKFMTNKNVYDIYKNMRPMRIAATMPIYTLRMTLLLPGKLKSMGISRLVKTNNSSRCDGLRLSHAVQRLMFWAEAGKNAFKDDGLEWEETPELELIVDRPYIFYIRWKNITLMNGNFVL